MTTTSTTTAPARLCPPARLCHSVAAEWTKLWSLRSTPSSLLTAGVLTIGTPGSPEVPR